jgi:hypothetical protein
MPDEAHVRRNSIDPDRLLPREDVNSPNLEDAEHWVGVYTELLHTKQQLVANLREMMERQPPDVQDELERADVQLLHLQIERFEKRRGFWQSRLRQLQSSGKPRRTIGTKSTSSVKGQDRRR